MTKINWNKTRDGFGGFDDATARDWARGPSDVDFENPDYSGRDFNLLALPSTYWATDMRKWFPDDTDEGHVELFNAATHAARHFYREHGWRMLKSRTEAASARASGRNPFPSAYYWIYLHYAGKWEVRLDYRARGVPLPKHVAEFYGYPLGRAQLLISAFKAFKLSSELEDWLREISDRSYAERMRILEERIAKRDAELASKGIGR